MVKCLVHALSCACVLCAYAGLCKCLCTICSAAHYFVFFHSTCSRKPRNVLHECLHRLNVFISEETNTVVDVEVDDKALLPSQDSSLSRVKRKAITSDHNLWPGGIIVYTMSGEVVYMLYTSRPYNFC